MRGGWSRGRQGLVIFSTGAELVAREMKEEPGRADAQDTRRWARRCLLACLNSVCTGQSHAPGQPCPSAISGTHRGTPESAQTC